MYRMATKIMPEALIQDPERYLAEGFYKNPELKDITKFILASIINSHPSLFFYYGLDKEDGFMAERNKAALSLIDKDPLSALFMYKFHRKPEYDAFWIPLLHSLLDTMDDVERAKRDKAFVSEMSYLIGAISKRYPDFAQAELSGLPRTESGESEY